MIFEIALLPIIGLPHCCLVARRRRNKQRLSCRTGHSLSPVGPACHTSRTWALINTPPDSPGVVPANLTYTFLTFFPTNLAFLSYTPPVIRSHLTWSRSCRSCPHSHVVHEFALPQVSWLYAQIAKQHQHQQQLRCCRFFDLPRCSVPRRPLSFGCVYHFFRHLSQRGLRRRLPTIFLRWR
jgi:hypothetical protein